MRVIMPVVAKLSLKSDWPLKPDTRQLHGLACALFERDSPADHLCSDKPFAIWPLRPLPDSAGLGWVLRAAWLRPSPPPAALTGQDQLRLGHVTCAITETMMRTVSHAQVAGGAAAARADLTFRSPTYFSHNGSDLVTPDPRLIVGSWRRTWNASLPEDDPMRISEDDWRELRQSAALAEFDLRTAAMDSGRGHMRNGFTGSATLRLSKHAPATAKAALGTLARFAEFSGTGAQTTHGFGATSLATLTQES
jgi:hypothetical protein